MLNTDKVRGILRAKQGSLIPKYREPASTLPKINGYSAGTLIATAKNPSDQKTIDESRISSLTTLKPESFKTKTKIAGKQFVLGAKNLFLKGIQGALNFLLENGLNLFNAGLNVLGNSFNDTEDSGLVDTAFLIGDTLGEYVPQAKIITTALKGINSIGGKEARQFSIDLATAAQVGSSYGGSMVDITNASKNSGKKYGLFSSGARKKANRLMNEAESLQNMMTNIANDARDMQAVAGNDLNYINYLFDINGGYDLRYMRAAKSGMKLQDKINLIRSRKFNLVINVNTKLIEEFKEGGSIQYNEVEWEPIIDDIADYWEPVIDDISRYKEGGKTRTLEELIEYAKKENPRFIQRLSEKPRGIKFTDDEGNEGEGSHYLEWSTDDSGNAIVYPRILEIKNDSLQFLPSNEAYKRAVNNKNILIMSPEEAEIFFAKDPEYVTAYKRGWPEFFKLFKDGGKAKEELETPEIEETTLKNLIPEGALHKNKHHMEHTEGLTLKGIPVIDNDGDQLAEIELDEIIFTLEVTKKLEELYKDGSDKAAIEAGKLLVKEILFNTDDRTGLIAKCEKGGKL